jgi:hypothetical protein
MRQPRLLSNLVSTIQNSLLCGTSIFDIHKLQSVQDTLPRLVISQSNISSVGRLCNLHRLPIDLRINFKLALVTDKTCTLHQHSYLSSLLFPHSTGRLLRSTNRNLLHQHRVRTVTGSRAFSSSMRKIWNSSPTSGNNLKLIFSHIFQCRPTSFCTGRPRLAATLTLTMCALCASDSSSLKRNRMQTEMELVLSAITGVRRAFVEWIFHCR